MASDTLFTLLRAALQCPSEGKAKIGLIDEATYKLAAEQGVQAIAWDGLAQSQERISSLNQQLKLRWALSNEGIEKRYQKQRQAIINLAAFYAKYGIKMMILKGFGLSLCYPKPEHRPCGDIDIWLFGEQERADRLLSEARGIEIDNDHHHHSIFYFDGVMVENHYDFINTESHLSNRNIEKELQVFAKQTAQSIELDGQTIYLPSADFNALFLLRHAAMHFAAVEIKLRHIIDWALFLKHFGTQVHWELILKIAREQNMDQFLHCINAIVFEQFGVPAMNMPKIDRNRSLEARVLDDILAHHERPMQSHNIIKRVLFKTQRWWNNRWKHRIVYKEGLIATFLMQVRAHLLKPKSI